MAFRLTKQTIPLLSRGWSLLSTGGGSKRTQLEQVLEQSLLASNSATILSLNELDDESIICTLYGVGVAGNSQVFMEKAITEAVNKLQTVIGKKIAAVFPGETNSSRAFQAAYVLNVPVIDADATGGRAVPEVQIDNFFLFNQSTIPIVVAAPDGASIVLNDVRSPEEIEKMIRDFMLTSGYEVVSVADHAISVKNAKGLLTEKVISRGIEIGELLSSDIEDDRLFYALQSKFGIQRICSGVVSRVELEKKEGFLQGEYVINSQNEEVVIQVKNENMFLQSSAKQIKPTYSILLLDAKTRFGIHNSELSVGTQVHIFEALIDPRWDSVAGKKLYGAY